MRQQINLYQDILIDKPEPFQSRQAGIALTVVMIGLIAIGGYSYWQTRSLQNKVAALVQARQAADIRVAELEKQYPPARESTQLQERIRRLEHELKAQRSALDYFSGLDQHGNETILASLEGLARSPLQGVWLRRVRLQNEGQGVQLAGSAMKPEQVPEYLQLLGDKNIFGGQVFARLKLNRLKERSGLIDFELNSEREATR